MLKNASVDALCKGLGSAPINWERTMTTVCRANHERHVPLSLQSLAAMASESHLAHTLRDQAKELDLDVTWYPLNEAERFGPFVARYLPNANYLFVSEPGQERGRVEYDQVIRVDGLFTIFEVKISAWKKLGHRKNSSFRAKSIRDLMTEKCYHHRFEPLKKFVCGERFAYVLMIPTDIISGSFASSPAGSEFTKQGGIVVPFPSQRVDWPQTVFNKLVHYGLLVEKDQEWACANYPLPMRNIKEFL